MSPPNNASMQRPARGRPSWPRVLALAVAVGCCAAGAVAADKKPTPAQKEAELKQVQTRIDRVRKAVNEDVEKRDRLSVELRDAELDVQKARKQLDDVRAQRIQSESDLQDLEQEQAEREGELSSERGSLAGELRAAYVNGREEQ